MADNYLSGKDGKVIIDDPELNTSQEFDFGKWKAEMEIGQPKATNYRSRGFQVLCPRGAIVGATITLDALTYNLGNMPLIVGVTYLFHLHYTDDVSLDVPAQVKRIVPDSDCEGGVPLTVVATSTGEFEASII